jgi:glycoside/pentoside/hexuronide:cation symporter, GPH family
MTSLTAPRLLAYALPALPLAILTVPFYVIVPTFYNSLGLPIAAVGFALLIIRLLDAFIDPVAGFLADATQSRFGRRKIWFAAGVPLTTLASIMLFLPPSHMSTTTYLLIWGIALSVGWTICLVPYQAWGAELATDYEGRNRVSGYREGIAFLGTLLALVTPEIVKQIYGGTTEASLAPTLQIFAIVIGFGLPLTAILTLKFVSEPVDRSNTRLNLRQSLSAMRGNKAFMRLLSAFLINGLANGLPATLFLLFVAERLQLPNSGGIFLLIYFAAGLIGVPLWLFLAGKFSKHRAWCFAMIMACGAFIFAPFLPVGAFYGFAIICVVTGLAVGADLALPASLQADVIDIDTATHGEQRSASYLAVWGLATKLALALAVGIAFPVLAFYGLDPGANLRSVEGLTALALLYAGLPTVLKLIAIGLMWNFPLTKDMQMELEREIRERGR